MKYKMIFLDIDGTLTDSSKKITPKTKKALLDAADKGLVIAIASGRPEPGLAYASAELELSERGGYILPFNGGIVKNMADGSIVMQYSLDKETVQSAGEIAAKHGADIITYKGDEIITQAETSKYIALESRINNMPVHKVDDFMTAVDFSPVKCLITAEPDIAAAAEIEAADRLEGRAKVFRSEPFFLEIMPCGIDKAESISRLIQQLGIDRSEIIACGDGFNDVSMIEFAGLGVCMENGCEPAKEAADYIAPSNDCDGIANVIEKFVLC